MPVEREQVVDLDALGFQQLGAAELGQVDDERGTDDLAAAAADQLGRRFRRTDRKSVV